ncbi:MAG: UPF0175 family protein [Caldilineales bacterium]|nr:UPF0175 family protein [Caldilineales bacterium]
MATQLTLSIPEDMPQQLKMSEAEFAREAQFLIAAKLYELGRLSSGRAAELAGMPRVVFLYMLDRYGVPAINLQAEEISHEISAAIRLAG